MRSGIGFDIHPLKEGRPLVLGGVTIPHEAGLDGDSDADVLTHAIIDSILGALSAGDIGSYFGVGTPEVMGIRSLDLLSRLTPLVKNSQFAISNIDSTIICEAPKLSVYRDKMRDNIAGALEIGINKVSVKLTTPKGLGALGHKKGIAVIAIATMEEK
jgi:2-C-methyl-D-erythritol 2,4-cyclodiphosphate synthase